jgi:MoxR-like ATPase
MRDWIVKEKNTTTETLTVPSNQVNKLAQLQETIGQVIKGKPQVVKLTLVALIAKGHLLIEDVPGIGKTTLANALARALDLSFQRIQFTSDLLPSDVIGISIFNQRTSEFEWKAGPIFSNIVLADEINRATPKTQSSLLEAMAEEQVTFEGISRPLPHPFMVVATQNPTEHHGTYPLPESQLDRFMLRLHVGYPNREDEKQIIRDREQENPLNFVKPMLNEADILDLQKTASDVRVDEVLVDYLLEIVERTRKHSAIDLGVSPRGTLSLFNSAQGLALIEGRDYCIADDIKRLVVPCFAHRLMLNSQFARMSGSSNDAEQVLKEILTRVKVPI